MSLASQSTNQDLQRFLAEIKAGQVYTFGEPWTREGHLSFIVPIIRTAPQTRKYVLAEEVKDQISVLDLGAIDRLRIQNDSETSVFVRSGLLFRGIGTQSRGSSAGLVLAAHSVQDILVKCVHASFDIAQGAALEISDVPAPEIVHKTLLRRDQGEVWASVEYAFDSLLARKGEGALELAARLASDDLLGVADELGAIKDDVDQLVREIPSFENQCGILVYDEEGIAGVEVFDSPESWAVLSRSVLERYGEVLSRKARSPIKVSLDNLAALEAGRSYFTRLTSASARAANSNTWILSNPLGEFTTIDGEVIHLLAFRSDGWEFAGPGVAARYADLQIDRFQFTGEGATPDRGKDFREGRLRTGARSSSGEPALFEAQLRMEPDASESTSLALEQGFGPAARRQVRSRETSTQRKKVLTSGWDPVTFEALEHFSGKEFRGDRSAALRSLVRSGLTRRGYLTRNHLDQWSRYSAPSRVNLRAAVDARDRERHREKTEEWIREMERIGTDPDYAQWLRARAREALEKTKLTESDETLRALAAVAVSRIIHREGESSSTKPKTDIEAAPTARSPSELRQEVRQLRDRLAASASRQQVEDVRVDVPGLLSRALIASASGNYTAALNLFDDILEVEPSNVNALIGKAVAYRRSGKPHEALNCLDLVLGVQPGNASALLNRGHILLEQGQTESALEAFDRLTQLYPNDEEAWATQGEVLLRMGREDDAANAFTEALKLSPADERIQQRILELEAVRRTHTERPEVSGGQIPRPGRVGGRGRLNVRVKEGQLYLMREKKPERALATFLQAVDAGWRPLYVTRQHPNHVRWLLGEKETRIVWLSTTPGKGNLEPHNLNGLINLITDFANEGPRAIVLVDGIEYLVINNDFARVLHFLERVNELIVLRRAALVLSIDDRSLDAKELALLGRFATTLEPSPSEGPSAESPWSVRNGR